MAEFLGIEIGGTKVQAARGDGLGAIHALARATVNPTAGRAGILEQLASLVPPLLTPDVHGIGIGFGGPVDADRGRVVTSHQVAGWDDFPIAEWCRATIGLPAVLGNDSDCAGWAEALFGAGRGFSPVVYMNIGSGIGGAIVIDGRLFNGHGKGAAEIGHLRMAPAEPGQRWRTLEDLASGWNLAQAARVAASRAPDSLLATLVDGHLAALDATTVVEAVRQRDPTALAVWRQAIEYWGVAIANAIALLSPQRIVMGGGVALAGDLLLDPLRAEVAKQCFAPLLATYAIVPAVLGEAVVLHGALALARQALLLGGE